jgi:60 kDa SS-A/Ro ribonucleoprotein
MSAGTCRHAIRDWFASKSSHAIFKASIGNDPSMRDILRMARPRPDSKEKAALYGYLKGAELDKKTGAYRTYNKDGSVRYEHPFEALPQIVREYEQYKMTKEGTPPNVDFRMLDSLGLGQSEWTDIARNAPWMMTRMNLNTFARHGVFEDTEVSDLIAARLSNREQIEKSRAFPYQLMSAWKATSGNEKVPHNVREALQDAMEIAIDNVPKINGQVFVCVDTSGSMGSPVTGDRRGYGAPSTSVSCVDVAGLIASSVVRNNSSAQVLTFKSDAVRVELNPRDTVLTNTEKLASAGGGTNCSSALAKLNQERATGDVIIYVSDYESWVDSDYGYGGGYGAGTGMLSEWSNFQERNPNAKLVCIDLTPGSNSQVKERPNILQVGGFSDTVFDVVKNFIEHGDSDNHWVDEIEKIEINSEKA